jgi:hypothetical protein
MSPGSGPHQGAAALQRGGDVPQVPAAPAEPQTRCTWPAGRGGPSGVPGSRADEMLRAGEKRSLPVRAEPGGRLLPVRGRRGPAGSGAGPEGGATRWRRAGERRPEAAARRAAALRIFRVPGRRRRRRCGGECGAGPCARPRSQWCRAVPALRGRRAPRPGPAFAPRGPRWPGGRRDAAPGGELRAARPGIPRPGGLGDFWGEGGAPVPHPSGGGPGQDLGAETGQSQLPKAKARYAIPGLKEPGFAAGPPRDPLLTLGS